MKDGKKKKSIRDKRVKESKKEDGEWLLNNRVTIMDICPSPNQKALAVK
jgi:hypothetical protein